MHERDSTFSDGKNSENAVNEEKRAENMALKSDGKRKNQGFYIFSAKPTKSKNGIIQQESDIIAIEKTQLVWYNRRTK